MQRKKNEEKETKKMKENERRGEREVRESGMEQLMWNHTII